MSGTIEIRTAKWKAYLTLGVSLLWLSLISLAFLDPSEEQFDFSMLLAIGFPLMGIIYSIYLILNRKPVITINDSDLIWHQSRLTTIPLNQITQVKLERPGLNILMFFMRTIEISLRDPDSVFTQRTAFQKSVLKMAHNMTDFHVPIPVFGLEKSPKEIYELIRIRAGLPIEPS